MCLCLRLCSADSSFSNRGFLTAIASEKHLQGLLSEQRSIVSAGNRPLCSKEIASDWPCAVAAGSRLQMRFKRRKAILVLGNSSKARVPE